MQKEGEEKAKVAMFRILTHLVLRLGRKTLSTLFSFFILFPLNHHKLHSCGRCHSRTYKITMSPPLCERLLKFCHRFPPWLIFDIAGLHLIHTIPKRY